MKQNQFKFKPLDQVLVRDTDQGIWKVTLFSHYDNECEKYKHVTVGGQYAYCVPYNEETANLIGTSKPYIEPEPVTWHVVSRDGLEKYSFTTKEFEQFLTNIVKNNKSVTEFRVKYIPK